MVDCDFPGGNIIVDEIEGDNVKLHQDVPIPAFNRNRELTPNV